MIGAFCFYVIPSLGGYTTLDDFYKYSIWGNLLFRIGVMQATNWLLLIPLSLQKNMSKMRFTTALGVACLAIIGGVIIYQLPTYISYNMDNKIFDVNLYDVLSSLKKDELGIFSAFATIIFAYTCHYGIFAVYNMLADNTRKRVRKVILRSVILDGSFYLIIGICGYLTFPSDVPKLIIERKSIGNSDVVMTICRLLAAVMLICKLPVSYNSLRNSLLNLIYKDNEVTTKR